MLKKKLILKSEVNVNNVVALCYSVLISRCVTRTTDNVFQNVLCTLGPGISINSQVESFYFNFQVALNHITGWVGSVVKKLTIHSKEHFGSVRRHDTGSPSSKYAASANIGIIVA